MTKKDLPYLPEFFDRYINLVDADLYEAFDKYSPDRIFVRVERLKGLKDRVYQEGKWTVKDILQHCIDTERVMTYRAMCISRGENVQLPGFDENSYALNTSAQGRTVDDLLEEFTLLRKSTVALFKHMDNAMLLREGKANKTAIYPLALAYVIIGHPLHHMKMMEEKYFPLLA